MGYVTTVALAAAMTATSILSPLENVSSIVRPELKKCDGDVHGIIERITGNYIITGHTRMLPSIEAQFHLDPKTQETIFSRHHKAIFTYNFANPEYWAPSNARIKEQYWQLFNKKTKEELCFSEEEFNQWLYSRDYREIKRFDFGA